MGNYYIPGEEQECMKCKDNDGKQMYVCPDCELLICWECYEEGSQVCGDCEVELEDLDSYLEDMEDDIEYRMFPNGRDPGH